MTRVKQRTSVTTRTDGSVSNQVYKVVFGVALATGIIIGLVSFAALGMGLMKAVALIIAGV